MHHAMHGHTETNSKIMKNYDHNKKFSFFKNRDVNSLYRSVMSQKLPANNFQ